MENIESFKNIMELEQNLLEPETRTSLDELNKFLADDFFEIGSMEKVWYKKDISAQGETEGRVQCFICVEYNRGTGPVFH